MHQSAEEERGGIEVEEEETVWTKVSFVTDYQTRLIALIATDDS